MPLILPRAILVGLFAALVTAIDRNTELPAVGIEVTPFEVAGGALGVLIVLRTNAGYDRWWEGRKLWGGIVNQCRNLGIAAVSYGPDDPSWRDRVVRLSAAFAHASRLDLREERTPDSLTSLLDRETAGRILASVHMPSEVSRLIGEALREGRDQLGLDGFGMLRIDEERATLIDHLGGCERILKTPLPLAYRVEIRRFLILFLASLPFALVWKIGWLTPAVTFIVAFLMLAIDKIGTELQYPFSADSLNHLPLEDICATIERDLLAMSGPPAVSKPSILGEDPEFAA
jgi:ion channel-forming bestrophin family protein